MHHRLARETSADDRLLDSLLDTPTCVRDMIYFLSDRGTPAADDPDTLADAADETIGDLMVSRPGRATIGLAEPPRPIGAVLAGSAERADAQIAGRAPQPASQKGTQARQAKRRKRKAVRAARRRNRG